MPLAPLTPTWLYAGPFLKKQLEQSLYDVDLLKDPQCLPTALRVKVKHPREPSRYEVTEP